MGKKIYYRVKFPARGEFRKQVALYALSRCFSLKKVLLIEGLFIVLPFMTMLPQFLADHQNQDHLPILILVMIIAPFGVHLWVALFWVLAMVLGVRYPKDAGRDVNGQFWFASDGFAAIDFGRIREYSYSSIRNIRETSDCFWVVFQNKSLSVLLKTNFLKGDPSTFAAFLKNPDQESDRLEMLTEAEEMQVPEVSVFRTEVTPNEEICIRNRTLEIGWAHENLSAAVFWGQYLSLFFMVLPILAMVFMYAISVAASRPSWAARIGDIFFMAVPGCILLGMVLNSVLTWRKRGVNYTLYRRAAVEQYQQDVKSGTALSSTSYLFLEDCFHVKRRNFEWVCHYTDICRLSRTEQYLILLVGSTVGATALALDRTFLGEDCERLMNFLKEKSGLEWMDSPV